MSDGRRGPDLTALSPSWNDCGHETFRQALSAEICRDLAEGKTLSAIVGSFFFLPQLSGRRRYSSFPVALKGGMCAKLHPRLEKWWFSAPKPGVASGSGHQRSQMGLILWVGSLLGALRVVVSAPADLIHSFAPPDVPPGDCAPTAPLSQTRKWRRHSLFVW